MSDSKLSAPNSTEEIVRSAVLDNLKSFKKFFLIDFDALPEAVMKQSLGGKARVPIDFIFECTLVNKVLLCRILGVEPGDWWTDRQVDANKFIVSQPDYTPAQARSEFEASLDAIIQAVTEASPEKLMSKVKTSSGEDRFFNLALFAGIHSNYHGAQLAYAQGLIGDDQNHWF